MFPCRRRRAISCNAVQEEMNAELAEIMKYDRSEPCNDPDQNEIECPLPGSGNMK